MTQLQDAVGGAPPKVFATLASYVVGKLIGPTAAVQAICKAVANPALDPPIPAVVALRNLRRLAEVNLWVEGGATRIAVTRARAMHAFLQSDAGLWLSIDDDVSADAQTLAWLCSAANQGAKPGLCIAPCLLRESAVANVEWSAVDVPMILPGKGGGKARRCERGGFALVAANRVAVEAIARQSPQFVDFDGETKAAPFLERIVDGRWLGEDTAFFATAKAAGVLAYALTTGTTWHDDAPLDLSTL